MEVFSSNTPDCQKILLHTIEASTLPYTVATPDGQRELIYVNPAFTECTLYSRQDSIQRNCSFLQGDETDSRTVDRLREGLDTFTPTNLELINYRKDGSPFWNNLRVSPVFSDSKEPIAFVGIQADITAHKNQENLLRERQKFEALGAASANISHEIKNSLQPLFLLKDILEDWENLDAATIDRTITAFGTNLNIAERVIRGFLKYSRNEIDHTDLVRTDRLFDNTRDFLKCAIPNRITLRSFLEESLEDSQIKLSESEFQQVILNLANNSTDAIRGKGSIEMHWSRTCHDGIITADQTMLAGDYVCIDILDDGCGLPKGKEAKIFDAFYSSKPPDQGTGIGLAVSKDLITRWNGEISAFTAEDSRTCFRILLPLN